MSTRGEDGEEGGSGLEEAILNNVTLLSISMKWLSLRMDNLLRTLDGAIPGTYQQVQEMGPTQGRQRKGRPWRQTGFSWPSASTTTKTSSNSPTGSKNTEGLNECTGADDEIEGFGFPPQVDFQTTSCYNPTSAEVQAHGSQPESGHPSSLETTTLVEQPRSVVGTTRSQVSLDPAQVTLSKGLSGTSTSACIKSLPTTPMESQGSESSLIGQTPLGTSPTRPPGSYSRKMLQKEQPAQQVCKNVGSLGESGTSETPQASQQVEQTKSLHPTRRRGKGAVSTPQATSIAKSKPGSALKNASSGQSNSQGKARRSQTGRPRTVTSSKT